MNVNILPITSVECIGDFEDEYVYDLEMEDDTDHTFFANDILVHNSNLISITDIRKKLNFELIDSNGDLTPEFVEIENKISDHLNTTIKDWAIEEYNSKDPRFFFKRESVCPRAIWTGKKHYILHLVNKEGEKMNKFKYSGMSLAKSTWSKTLKDLSKEIVETAIMTSADKSEADRMIFELFDDKFKKLPVKDIAERASIKVLNKWEPHSNGMNKIKGSTQNAQWTIFYNELLKKLKLDNKYPKVANGSKIKKVFVKDNQYNIEGIAFQDELPPEFGLEVDYDASFYKGVMKTLEPIYEALGWNLPDPNKQVEISLDDLFG